MRQSAHFSSRSLPSIGMLLEHEEPYTHNQEPGKNGLIQHNIYSWLVGPKGFTRLDNVDSKSTFIDHTLKEWVRKMTHRRRERSVHRYFL